ncbi:MAG TPA: c-type cytochrome [Chthoniobacteraceae bacterium]|nr:c-type cytochrome [Chthoniobacteraceae bacterium]
MPLRFLRHFVSALILGSPAFAVVTAPALPDAPAKNEPGLILTLTSGGMSDTRGARLVSLYAPAGKPVSPFLPAGPFTARWEGEILSSLRAEYTFSAEVKGTFKLTLNGQLILEGAGDSTAQSVNKAVQLNKGGNKLVAEFSNDGTTDGMVQLKWWSKEFPAEPVPPMVFQRNASDKALRDHTRVREGRLLFAQLRCAVCHDATGIVPPRGEGMPELAQTAPIFGELGAKFNENFLAHWINDPHSIRPHSLMPRVFAEGTSEKVDQRAADLAAYFASLGKKDDTSPAAENAPLGGALFANFGCISCHTTPDFEGEDEHGRVPLGHVKAKWQPKALREFLKDPAKEYPHIRMPNFRLTDEEAERLTSYLIENAKREFPEAPKGDPAKGGALLVSAGCISCHAGAPMMGVTKLADTLAKDWSKGCLASDEKERGKAPDFHLTKAQRESLLAFGAKGFDSLKQDVPIEVAERQVKNLRCNSCHTSDGAQSVWSQLEGDMIVLQSGAPSSDAVEHAPVATTAVPALTWLGEKLHPAWMEKFIAGQVTYKPRPWIIGRMPGFGAWAKDLSEGFAHAHGLPVEIAPVKTDPERVKFGEQLIGENGGFNCVQCHNVGSRQATAVFEAPGNDLGRVQERLRHDYFLRWVLHPLRIDPESKMPRFSDDEGRTPLTDILEGKAIDQFDAIWQYLHTVKE